MRIFYRRVTPSRWEDEARTIPSEAAFHRKDAEEGLSVFDAIYSTPDSVLQHQIDFWRHAGDTKQLDKCRSTPEGMRERGWGVVEISADEFTARHYQFTEAEPDGHLEILGSAESFQEHAPVFVLASKRCD